MPTKKKSVLKSAPTHSLQRKTLKTGRKPVSPNTFRSPDTHQPSFDRLLVRLLRLTWTLITYSFVFLLGGVVAATAIGLVVSILYLRVISVHANTSIPQLIATASDIRASSIVSTDGRKNMLILGTDSLSNRDSSAVLTDTVMVLSIDLDDAHITTFSFPRDLYIASHSAKINALLDKNLRVQGTGESLQTPADPAWRVKGIVEHISGVPIHNVIILDIVTVGKIIDAFGGLEVAIERSFVDYQFPRLDVDVRIERDPAKLYEVVAFTQGKEVMTGDRALRYIRSRKSTDPIEGTDDARVRRQQRVIAALITKLKDPNLARNPEQVGKLIAIYNEQFSASLPLAEVGAIAWTMMEKHQTPTLTSYQFPIQGNGTKGVFYHPERHPSGAWVYLPVDPMYADVRNQVAGWLNSIQE